MRSQSNLLSSISKVTFQEFDSPSDSPHALNFAIKSPWGIRSNALDRSIKMAATHS